MATLSISAPQHCHAQGIRDDNDGGDNNDNEYIDDDGDDDDDDDYADDDEIITDTSHDNVTIHNHLIQIYEGNKHGNVR